MYSLIVFTKSGKLILRNIEEYVGGNLYFYARYNDGKTVTIPREEIINVKRKLKNGGFRDIKLKQFNFVKRRGKSDGDSGGNTGKYYVTYSVEDKEKLNASISKEHKDQEGSNS
jgi:hypothetical protein